jgi:hypothetical protein
MLEKAKLRGEAMEEDLLYKKRRGVLDHYASHAKRIAKPIAVVTFLDKEGHYTGGHGFTDPADIENLERVVRVAQGNRGVA